jgi:hypothetical protein
MCGRLISLNLVLPRGLSARRDFPTHARGGKWPFAFGRQVATCRSEGRGPRSEFEAPRPSRLSLSSLSFAMGLQRVWGTVPLRVLLASSARSALK